MNSKHPTYVSFELPELTPEQAGALLCFLHELESTLWDNYDKQLLAFHDVAEDENTIESQITDDEIPC